MTYLKPSFFVAKVFNKVAKATGLSGIEVLEVRRRSNGGLQEIPVLPIEIAGCRYLVSVRGEAQWVRNVRADPMVTLKRRSTRKTYRAVEIPVEKSRQIIKTYRERAGKTVDVMYWKKLPEDVDHPVFKLVSGD